MAKQIDSEMVEEIRACIPKKNANQCIDKILAEHEIDASEKSNILLQVMRTPEARHDEKSK